MERDKTEFKTKVRMTIEQRQAKIAELIALKKAQGLTVDQKYEVRLLRGTLHRQLKAQKMSEEEREAKNRKLREEEWSKDEKDPTRKAKRIARWKLYSEAVWKRDHLKTTSDAQEAEELQSNTVTDTASNPTNIGDATRYTSSSNDKSRVKNYSTKQSYENQKIPKVYNHFNTALLEESNVVSSTTSSQLSQEDYYKAAPTINQTKVDIEKRFASGRQQNIYRSDNTSNRISQNQPLDSNLNKLSAQVSIANKLVNTNKDNDDKNVVSASQHDKNNSSNNNKSLKYKYWNKFSRCFNSEHWEKSIEQTFNNVPKSSNEVLVEQSAVNTFNNSGQFTLKTHSNLMATNSLAAHEESILGHSFSQIYSDHYNNSKSSNVYADYCQSTAAAKNKFQQLLNPGSLTLNELNVLVPGQTSSFKTNAQFENQQPAAESKLELEYS